MSRPCGCGWEALSGDPLSWLLDRRAPNLHWRVLIELVGRPQDSQAVRRAQGGASASEPVASLLAKLHPDGSWATDTPTWKPCSGPGWRMVAAVQWGADPTDPRLDAAITKILDETPGDGGFAIRQGDKPSAVLTARLVQAAAGLGHARHLRVQEAMAWFEEADEAWSGTVSADTVAATAVLAALAEGAVRRRELQKRLVEVLFQGLAASDGASARFGHPNFGRTDVTEILWALARAGVPWHGRLTDPLRRLQKAQSDGGRWARRYPVPRSLPLDPETVPSVGQSSRWITLRAVVALNTYAVAAGLPRLFPEKPVAR